MTESWYQNFLSGSMANFLIELAVVAIIVPSKSMRRAPATVKANDKVDGGAEARGGGPNATFTSIPAV